MNKDRSRLYASMDGVIQPDKTHIYILQKCQHRGGEILGRSNTHQHTYVVSMARTEQEQYARVHSKQVWQVPIDGLREPRARHFAHP